NSETTITINGETTTMSNSTEGVEAKTINMNGGNMYITASDDGINTTASTQTGGTESNDGSYLYMKGGVLTTIASSGDAIDSNGSIFMTGGILVDFDPSNNTNEDIDANGSIAINGGLLFGGCMHSQMFEIVSGTSQVGVNLKSSSAVSTTSGFIQIKDASGIVIGTFKTPQTYYNFHLSSPDMKTSTKYSIYTGGTVTGGYCTGGTYGGGTLKKSFTTGTVKISTLTL
ncbi:MAG: carbohydrate-binding protein, partial [Bacteroidetes bacterium]|nr:carbohydrate-binding protein [Bacteroidota bacterium]